MIAKRKEIIAILFAVIFFICLYFSPILVPYKALIFFVGLAVLMEFWIIQLPKHPAIFVVDALYIACLFLFSIKGVVFIVLIGTLARIFYFRTFSLIEILKLVRRLVILSISSIFFEKIGLKSQFAVTQRDSIFSQFQKISAPLKIFLLWAFAYAIVKYFLAQFEKMILRKSGWVAIEWKSLAGTILFNSIFIAPLGLLMYILYQLLPSPFPYALILLILPLLVIYRSIRNYTNSLDAAKFTIENLADAVDRRLQFSVAHSKNVSESARNIAIALQLSDEEVELIERAARIHDLGKVGIADKILSKPDSLTQEELAIIHKHPETGAKIAGQLSIYEKEVALIRSHHERYDGSGYPLGLRQEEIPLGARVIAVADTFHAMLNDRPHRKKFSEQEVVHEIKEQSGKKFDPKVVQAFLKVIQKNNSKAQ